MKCIDPPRMRIHSESSSNNKGGNKQLITLMTFTEKTDQREREREGETERGKTNKQKQHLKPRTNRNFKQPPPIQKQKTNPKQLPPRRSDEADGCLFFSFDPSTLFGHLEASVVYSSFHRGAAALGGPSSKSSCLCFLFFCRLSTGGNYKTLITKYRLVFIIAYCFYFLLLLMTIF